MRERFKPRKGTKKRFAADSLTHPLIYTSTPEESQKPELARFLFGGYVWRIYPPQAERNEAAKKYHKEFAVLNFQEVSVHSLFKCCRVVQGGRTRVVANVEISAFT